MKDLWIYDTEGDGLAGNDCDPANLITKFHCLLFKKYGKNKWVLFLDHSHPEFEQAKTFAESKGKNLIIKDFRHGNDFKEWIREKDVAALGCHNQFGFDLKAFKRLWNIDSDMFPENMDGVPIKLFDTLSMSRALYPDRPLPHGCPAKVKNPLGGKAKTIGPHGLEAWGFRVANKKVEIEDWRGLPLWKYVDRVWEDVIINELVWSALMSEMKPIKDLGIDWKIPLRHNLLSDYLMEMQEEQGVCFDKELAERTLVYTDDEMDKLAAEVEPHLPKKLLPKSQRPNFPKEPFTGKGEISSHGWNWLEKHLGYKINREALTFKAPPKTAFKGNGEISANGIKYCEKNGVTDPEQMADFLRSQKAKGESLQPLPDDLMIKARKALIDKEMPDMHVPMRIGDGDDIKEWLVGEGWRPTLFNTKKVTLDERKQNRPEEEVRRLVLEYVEDVRQSPYKMFIYRELDINLDLVRDEEKLWKHLKRKARFLPTSPKLKDQNGILCPNLAKIEGALAKCVVKWLSYRNRRAVIKTKDPKKQTGWLWNNRLLHGDGKLSARYTGLTPTNRRKHTVVANIPSTGALLGHEMRAMFTVPEGYWQLGIDGSNLEGMCAAWASFEFDNGEYLSRMQGVDNHAIMAEAYSKAAGKEISRSDGKPITYGVLYGCQAAKAAEMLGTSKEIGQQVIDAYWDTNFGLKGRKEWLEAYWEKSGKKFIQGVDGRKIWTRSKHSLLNARLQSAGAIGMDLAGIMFHEKAKKEGLLAKGVARTVFYHDEYQLQVPDELMKWKKFETGVEDAGIVNNVMAELKKAKKAKKNGKEFLSYAQIGMLFGITEQDVENIKNAKDSADNVDGKGFLLSGNTYTFEDGSIGRNFSKAGVLMVEAIEEAYQFLDCPVKITGEYLCGKNWADCH